MQEALAALAAVTTATITTVLLKKGIRNAYMRGPKPFTGEAKRVVGPAFTLRFLPAREDLATPEKPWASPRSTRAAIEDMPAGVVCVADARGLTDAGIFGDILVARMGKRGVAALVTDGSMRDAEGILKCDLPIWCADAAAPSSVGGHTFVGWQEPIGCGGVAVFPGDIVVADKDGAVLVPIALVEEVASSRPNRRRSRAGRSARCSGARRCPASIRPTRRPRHATRPRRRRERVSFNFRL